MTYVINPHFIRPNIDNANIKDNDIKTVVYQDTVSIKMFIKPRKTLCNADLFISEPCMERYVNNMNINDKFTSCAALNRIKTTLQNEFKSLPQSINTTNCPVMVDSQQQVELFDIIANTKTSNEIDIIKLKHALQNTRHIDIINDWLKGDKYVVSSGMDVYQLQKHSLNRFIKYEILNELSGMNVQRSFTNNGQSMKLGNDIIDMINSYHDNSSPNQHLKPMRISHETSINYKYLFNITNASNVVKINLKEQLQQDKIHSCNMLLDIELGKPCIRIMDNKLKLAAEQFQLLEDQNEKVNTFQHAVYNINKPIDGPQSIGSDHSIMGYNIYMSCVVNIKEEEYDQIYACKDAEMQRQQMYQIINDKYKEHIIRDPLYYDNLMVAYHIEVFRAQSQTSKLLDNITMRILNNEKEHDIMLDNTDDYHRRKHEMKDIIATNCRTLTGRLQNLKAQRDNLNLKIQHLQTIMQQLQISLGNTQPTNNENNEIIQNVTIKIKNLHKEMIKYQKQIKSSIQISKNLTDQFDACETIHRKMEFGCDPIIVTHKLIAIKRERQTGLQYIQVSFIKRGRKFPNRSIRHIPPGKKSETFTSNKIEHMNIINMKSGNINGQSRYKLSGKYYEDKLNKISQAYRTKKTISYISSLESQNNLTVDTISSQINQKGINFNYKYIDVIKTCTEHNRLVTPPFNWQQEQTSNIMCKWLPDIKKILFFDREQRKIWVTKTAINNHRQQEEKKCINDTILKLFNSMPNSTLPYRLIYTKPSSYGNISTQQPHSQPHNFKQKYGLYKSHTYKLVSIISRSIINNQMEQEPLLHTSIVEFLDTKTRCIVPNFKIESFNWDLMGTPTTRNHNISDPNSIEMTLKREITKILKEDLIYKHLCTKYINATTKNPRYIPSSTTIDVDSMHTTTYKIFMVNKKKRISQLISSNIMRLISKFYNSNKYPNISYGNMELSNLMFKVSHDRPLESRNAWRPIWQMSQLSHIESKCHLYALNNKDWRYKHSISIYDIQRYLINNSHVDEKGDFNRFFDIFNAPYTSIVRQTNTKPLYLQNAEHLQLPDLEAL